MPTNAGVDLVDEYVERALELDPNHERAHFTAAMLRTASYFEFAQGHSDFARAAGLEPGNAQFIFNGVLGDYEAAAAAVHKSLSLNPSFPVTHDTLARIFLEQRRIDAARAKAELERVEIYRLAGLARVQHESGNALQAKATLEWRIETGARIAATQIAEVFAVTGDADHTIEWLETARRNRDSGVAKNIVGLAKDFRLLHADPRWSDFLECMGLLAAWQEMPPKWGGPATSVSR